MKEQGKVIRSERYYGRFERVLSLHRAVGSTKATASYKDGVLTITLPKTEAAKPKSIDISAN